MGIHQCHAPPTASPTEGSTITRCGAAPTLPAMLEAGAAIIDIGGGKSTRPGAGRDLRGRGNPPGSLFPPCARLPRWVRPSASIRAAPGCWRRRFPRARTWSMMSRPCVMIRAAVEVAGATGLSGGADARARQRRGSARRAQISRCRVRGVRFSAACTRNARLSPGLPKSES